jgi:hypothetical protein
VRTKSIRTKTGNDYGKLESGEFAHALVDLVAGTFGIMRKIDLKADDLMSPPAVTKANCGTVYLIITRSCNGDFVYEPRFHAIELQPVNM